MKHQIQSVIHPIIDQMMSVPAQAHSVFENPLYLASNITQPMSACTSHTHQ